MSTVYAWDDPGSLTALDTSTADKVFLYDASAGGTRVATLYDIGQETAKMPVATLSSNGAAASGTVSGVTLMGTSTAAVLAAAEKVGLTRLFGAGTSTVAYTITASGSSFGTGAVYTALGGGQVGFRAVSTSRWAITGHYAHGSTLLA